MLTVAPRSASSATAHTLCAYALIASRAVHAQGARLGPSPYDAIAAVMPVHKRTSGVVMCESASAAVRKTSSVMTDARVSTAACPTAGNTYALFTCTGG